MTTPSGKWLPIVALVLGAVVLHALFESFLTSRTNTDSASNEFLLERIRDLEKEIKQHREAAGAGGAHPAAANGGPHASSSSQDHVTLISPLLKQIEIVQKELEGEKKKVGDRSNNEESNSNNNNNNNNENNNANPPAGETSVASEEVNNMSKRISELELLLQVKEIELKQATSVTIAAGTGNENSGGSSSDKSGAAPKTLTLVIDAIAEGLDDNTKYFLRHGIFNDGTADFVFVSNGYELRMEELVAEMGQEMPNVKIINRSNEGFDFCAWKETIASEGSKKPYTHFILLNRTVRGPFLPSYYKDTWVTAVLSPMNERVGVVGLSINCRAPPRPVNPELPWPISVFPEFHLQSMFLAMDVRAKNAFMKNAGCYNDKHDVIFKNEIVTAYWFLQDAKVQVASLMQLWKDVDVDDEDRVRNRCARCAGDPFWVDPQIQGKLFIHPLETVFVKTSRIETGEIHYFSEWADDNLMYQRRKAAALRGQ